VKVDFIVTVSDYIVNCVRDNTAVHRDDAEVTVDSGARTALSELNADCKREVHSGVKQFYITAFKYLTSNVPAVLEQ